MNLLSNCINLTSNPMVNASVDRNSTVIRSVGKNGLDRIEAALNNSVNDATVSAAKELAHAQAVALDDDWTALTENYAFRTGFMHQALGESSMGSTSNIEAATVQEIAQNARRLNEVGMVIAAVGDVDHDAFVKDCEAKFGHLHGATGDKVPAQFVGSCYDHRFDSTNFGMLSVLHHVPAPGHNQAINFEVAAEIIGSYDPKRHGNHCSAAAIRRRFGKRPGPGNARGAGSSDLNSGLDVEFFTCDYKVVAGNAVLQWTSKTLGQKSPSMGLYDEANLRAMLFISNMFRRCNEFEVARGKNNFMMSLANSLERDPLNHVGTSTLNYGHVGTVASMKPFLGQVTAATMKKAFYNYVNDQEVAAAKTGCTEKLLHNSELRSLTMPKLSLI